MIDIGKYSNVNYYFNLGKKTKKTRLVKSLEKNKQIHPRKDE